MNIVPAALGGLRRRMRRPFPACAGRHPLIVHCCHHKVGTVWLTNVLSAVAASFGLRLYSGEQRGLDDGVDIFLQDHSRIDRTSLRDFRGSHMVRDPRDVVISGYFHHRRTSETWVLQPREEYGGRSYQQHLNGLDREAGILAEVERSASTVVRDMLSWRYETEGFLEIRYEDLLLDEEAGFRRLFSHYGFSLQSVECCVATARRFSLGRVKGRSTHIRSGQPGDWRAHFSDDHKAAFKRLTDDAAVILGYETDSNW